MPTIYHDEHVLDHDAMQVMRTMLALHPAARLGPQMRPEFDAQMENTPAAEDVSYEAAEVGGVAGWWCRPAGANAGTAILYLHGGAYIVGSAAAYRSLVGQIAARVGAPAFVPDYALAPEHPVPAALEDAFAVYQALAAGGAGTIALVGDSAGGGLALALLSRATAAARQALVPRPVCLTAMSPWTDLALTGASMSERASADPLLSSETLSVAAELYLAGHNRLDPQASPLFGDLRDLPPILLHVGEDEVLLDDARRYAKRTEEVGGLAELHIWKGMVHVFPASLGLLRAAAQALDDIGVFLRRHIAGGLTMR